MKIITPLLRINAPWDALVVVRPDEPVRVASKNAPERVYATFPAGTQVTILPDSDVEDSIRALATLLATRNRASTYSEGDATALLKRVLRRFDAARKTWKPL